MIRFAAFALCLAALTLAACGCGGQPATGGGTSPPAATASSSGLPANLDQGPRAAESPVNEEKAEAGESLFKDKGCTACHAFGKRGAGPDLAGVTRRRTAQWMESQILHPDLMVKSDPVARQMFAEFALQMPKQGLTPEEARAVIEYFKQQDHGSSEGHQAGKEND